MKKHKVLLVHNYYQIPGGEDTVVANEKKLLEEHGHEVLLYTRHNHELKTLKPWQKLLLPFSTIFNLRTYREVKRIIRDEAVDIVHVHNILNLVSPAVYYAALACKVPVVQTVHNFRLLCPGATFYRDGRICEDCLERGLGCALKHKCYRGSRLQTLACVISMLVHRATGIYGKIHYICLTEFNKSKLLHLKQIPDEIIFIKPNFAVELGEVVVPEQRTDRIIYVGRLEKLKGVHILLEAWKQLGTDAPELLLCGTGPLEQWCDDFIVENRLHMVKRLGFVPNREVRELIANSRALILPTQCYESFPMTIPEAYAVGTPVITGNMGNAGNLVEEGSTGMHFVYNSPESLAQTIGNLRNENPALWGENARRKYRQAYTPEANYEKLYAIYMDIEKNESQ